MDTASMTERSSKKTTNLPLRAEGAKRRPRVDDIVTIYDLALIRRPQIEGRAIILDVLDPSHDLYRVRFLGEAVPRQRIVHPGAWQTEPQEMLTALLSHWRMGLSPEALTNVLIDELPSRTGGQ